MSTAHLERLLNCPGTGVAYFRSCPNNTAQRKLQTTSADRILEWSCGEAPRIISQPVQHLFHRWANWDPGCGSFSSEGICYGLNCALPKFICSSPEVRAPLEVGSLQVWLVKRKSHWTRVGTSSSMTGVLWRRGDLNTEKLTGRAPHAATSQWAARR